MRLSHTLALAAAIVTLMPSAVNAQASSETSRSVAGGGVSVPGWTGKIDASKKPRDKPWTTPSSPKKETRCT